jgi:hypothetical protein
MHAMTPVRRPDDAADLGEALRQLGWSHLCGIDPDGAKKLERSIAIRLADDAPQQPWLQRVDDPSLPSLAIIYSAIERNAHDVGAFFIGHDSLQTSAPESVDLIDVLASTGGNIAFISKPQPI